MTLPSCDLFQALCSSNLPKLLERDTPLFMAILGDLFPRKTLPVPSHNDLHRGIEAAAKTMGLRSLTEQTVKVDQLHETLEVSCEVITSISMQTRNAWHHDLPDNAAQQTGLIYVLVHNTRR